MDNRSCVHFGCCRQQFATLLDHNLVTLCVSLPRTPVTLLPHPPAPQSHRELHNFCSTSVCQFLSRTRLKDDLPPQSWWSCIHSKNDCQWKYIWCKTTSNTLQGHISCSVHRPPMSVLWCSVWRLRAVWPIWWQDKALPSFPPPLIPTCFGQPAGDVETVNSPGQYHFVVFCNNVFLINSRQCIATRTNNRLKLFRLFWRLEFKAADSSSSSSSCKYRINIEEKTAAGDVFLSTNLPC